MPHIDATLRLSSTRTATSPLSLATRYSTLLLVLCLALASAGLRADETPAAAAPPSWFTDNVKLMSADGGRWIASNAQYKSDDEPWEAYGVHWVAGPGNGSMSGRLFGVKDGKDSADFWRFSQHWDPARKVAVVEQFGWGNVGIGTFWPEGELMKMRQVFTSYRGTARVEGHQLSEVQPDSHRTTSFAIDGEKWTPQRQYLWERRNAEQ